MPAEGRPTGAGATASPELRLANLNLRRSVLAPQVLNDDDLNTQIEAANAVARAQNEARKQQIVALDEAIAAAEQDVAGAST